ncbi:MAG TPA: hypothetical protein DCO79_03125 [Spirochaeta sp.]|nr:hypothetical protein [Spirochaeta sp.]
MLRNRNKSIIISYYTLRRLIGILGILLPFICMFGGLAAGIEVQSSVSAYYHSNMRELFTGLMSCMAVFLLTY